MKSLFAEPKLMNLSNICKDSKIISIISHINPDGDAIGSGLALLYLLQSKFAHARVRFFVPNHYPEYLKWLAQDGSVEIFNDDIASSTAFIAASDVIFIADFNQPSRIEKMYDAIEANLGATKVLIDHHIAPPDYYDISFHSTESSSTAFLVYNLIHNWFGTDSITEKIAQALYVGIITDTGCFSFGNLTSELFRAAAILVEKGVNPPQIHRNIYDAQSENRLRMIAYLVSNNMTIEQENKSGYITISIEEKERFKHQIGDTEGIVNMPLSIKGIEFSAIMVENKDHIKISLRSVGNIDVNLMSNEHFNGGGHKNAAGGKTYGSLEDAVDKLKSISKNIDRYRR